MQAKSLVRNVTRGHLWSAYGAYLVLLVVCAFMSQGWLQPDEHTRTLEPAHYIAYGYATLPWEFKADFPIVSFLLGAIHAWILVITKALGLSGMAEAALLRAFTAVICSTRLIALYLILPMVGFASRFRLWYLFFFAFNIFGPLIFVRTSHLNWSATALAWSLFFLLKLISTLKVKGLHPLLHWRPLMRGHVAVGSMDAATERESTVYSLLVGILMALCVSFRLQCGPSVAALGLVVWWILGFKRSLPILLGVMIGLVPTALVDGWLQGVPFKSAYNYLMYALSDEEGGGLWGSNPWYFYFVDYFAAWFPPLSPLLLPPLVIGLLRLPILAVPFVPFLVVHCILGHKETRYFMPMLPIMQLATCAGFEWLLAKWPGVSSAWAARPGLRKIFYSFVVFNIAISLAAAMVPLNTSPLMFTKLKELRESNLLQGEVLFVGNTRSSMAQFYVKDPEFIPPQMGLNEFLQQLREDPDLRLPETLALYCVSMADLREIEAKCRVTYLSVPAWYASLAGHIPNPRHSFRVHAIAHCPTIPLAKGFKQHEHPDSFYSIGSMWQGAAVHH